MKKSKLLPVLKLDPSITSKIRIAGEKARMEQILQAQQLRAMRCAQNNIITHSNIAG